MSGSSVDWQAFESYKKVEIMIRQWQLDNHGALPKYVFLSDDAITLLSRVGKVEDSPGRWKDVLWKSVFMNIEVVPVGVPGIYAAIGGEF